MLHKVKEDINNQKQKLHFLENAFFELQKQSGKYGLKKEDYSKQFKKQRQRKTAGYKRIKESDISKIDSTILMIKRAVKRGFKFDYVLTDSWFFCGKLLKFIASLNNSIHLVSMAKLGNAKYKVLPANKYLSAKQYLLLGKSQSQDFDAQIADTTLSLIRYILLSYYERIHYGISIGGLFRKLSQAAVEENLVADLSSIFMELLMAFAQLAGIDFITVYEELIRQPNTEKLVTKLRIIPNLGAA